MCPHKALTHPATLRMLDFRAPEGEVPTPHAQELGRFCGMCLSELVRACWVGESGNYWDVIPRQVQVYTTYNRSMYPRIISAREFFVFTSHANNPLLAWDTRWVSVHRSALGA